MLDTKELLNQALQLRTEDRFEIVEGLIKSLDEPDATIDDIWSKETERRLCAYRAGRLKAIPLEDVLTSD